MNYAMYRYPPDWIVMVSVIKICWEGYEKIIKTELNQNVFTKFTKTLIYFTRMSVSKTYIYDLMNYAR